MIDGVSGKRSILFAIFAKRRLHHSVGFEDARRRVRVSKWCNPSRCLLYMMNTLYMLQSKYVIFPSLCFLPPPTIQIRYPFSSFSSSGLCDWSSRLFILSGCSIRRIVYLWLHYNRIFLPGRSLRQSRAQLKVQGGFKYLKRCFHRRIRHLRLQGRLRAYRVLSRFQRRAAYCRPKCQLRWMRPRKCAIPKVR